MTCRAAHSCAHDRQHGPAGAGLQAYIPAVEANKLTGPQLWETASFAVRNGHSRNKLVVISCVNRRTVEVPRRWYAVLQEHDCHLPKKDIRCAAHAEPHRESGRGYRYATGRSNGVA